MTNRKAAGLLKWLLPGLAALLLLWGCSSGNRESSGAGSVFSAMTSFFGGGDDLHMYFLDVGQGDAALVQYKGKHLLIDTGHMESRGVLVKALKEKGVETLDAVLISHPHSDHLGGMSALLDHFSVGQVYDNGDAAEDAMYNVYMKKLAQQHIPRTTLQKDDMITFAEDIQLTVFGPEGKSGRTGGSADGSDENNRSIICKVTYGSFSAMFTGDAEAEAEAQVLKSYSPAEVRAAVLKVGHHGSKTSTTPEFVAAVRPKEAVISCGTGNPYDFPHQQTTAVLTRCGAVVHRTDRQGEIAIRSDGQTYTVDHER